MQIPSTLSHSHSTPNSFQPPWLTLTLAEVGTPKLYMRTRDLREMAVLDFCALEDVWSLSSFLLPNPFHLAWTASTCGRFLELLGPLASTLLSLGSLSLSLVSLSCSPIIFPSLVLLPLFSFARLCPVRPSLFFLACPSYLNLSPPKLTRAPSRVSTGRMVYVKAPFTGRPQFWINLDMSSSNSQEVACVIYLSIF